MSECNKNEMPAHIRVLRLFGLPGQAVQEVVDTFPEKWGLAARCMTRGGETLVLLEARDSAGLDRARRTLRAACPDALYGEGAATLTEATAQALLDRNRLLACGDADAGTLLEPRLESVPGAEQVFDFGSQSYAHPQNRDKIAAGGERSAAKYPLDPWQRAAGRVLAARRVAGADLAAGCVPQAGGAVLLVGGKKGVWSRAVPQGENPALWLLDMIRRAACGLEQAEGTHWTRYGAPLPEALAAAAAAWDSHAPEHTAPAAPLSPQPGAARPADGPDAPSPDVPSPDAAGPEPGETSIPGETPSFGETPAFGETSALLEGPDMPVPSPAPWVPERGGHAVPPAEGTAGQNASAAEEPPAAHPALRRRKRRWPLVLLLALVLLGAAVAGVWFYTGGNLELVLKWLGIREFTLSGASLL